MDADVSQSISALPILAQRAHEIANLLDVGLEDLRPAHRLAVWVAERLTYLDALYTTHVTQKMASQGEPVDDTIYKSSGPSLDELLRLLHGPSSDLLAWLKMMHDPCSSIKTDVTRVGIAFEIFIDVARFEGVLADMGGKVKEAQQMIEELATITPRESTTPPIVVEPRPPVMVVDLRRSDLYPDLLEHLAFVLKSLEDPTTPECGSKWEANAEAYDRLVHSEVAALLPPTLESARSEPPFPLITSLDTTVNRSKFTSSDPQQALALIRLLQEPTTFIARYVVAWATANLAVCLFTCELYDEAAAVSIMASRLYESLVEESLDPRLGYYVPHYVFALLNVARCEWKVSDVDDLDTVLGDALKVAGVWVNELRERYGGNVAEESDGDAKAKTRYARYILAPVLTASSSRSAATKAYESALTDAQKAVTLYDDLEEEFKPWKEAFGLLTPPLAQNATSSEFPDAAASLADEIPQWAGPASYYRFVHMHGSALHQLSFSLEAVERNEEAFRAEKRALAYFHSVQYLFPQTHLEILAEAYYHLNQSSMQPYIKNITDNVFYIKQTLAYYRHIIKSTKALVLSYYNALFEAGLFLNTKTRYIDALDVWNECVEVSGNIMLDPLYLGDAYRHMAMSLRKLNRHTEAIEARTKTVEIYHDYLRPVTYHEADGWEDLAVEYHIAKRHQESLLTAMQAEFCYRILESDGGDLGRKKLADCLAHQSLCYGLLQDPKAAREKGELAIDIYVSVELRREWESSFEFALRVAMNGAFAVDDEGSVEFSRRCVDRLKLLYEENEGFWREPYANAMSSHGFKLNKHGMSLEAIQWTEDSLDWYSEQPLEKEIDVTDGYIATLINIGDDLGNQGRLEKAMMYTKQAIEVGEKYCEGKESSVSFIACALHNLPELLVDLGRFEEALQPSLDAVEYSRTHSTFDLTQLAGALRVQATVLARLDRFDEALAVALESVQICEESPIFDIAKRNMFAPLQTIRCLRNMAEIKADMGDPAEGLKFIQRALSELNHIRDDQANVLPKAFSDVTLGYCLATEGEMLAANGRIEDAITCLQGLLDDQRELVEKKPGNYPRLAPVFRLLGMCYCAVGKHEEGKTTFENFGKVEVQMRTENQEVVELMGVELDKESKRPNHGTLLKKLDYGCGHWDSRTR